MSALSSTVALPDGAAEGPKVYFGRGADGMLVGQVGDHAFAMAPARDGRHYLATVWHIRIAMAQWTRGDFYGHAGELADESAFRAKVFEQAEHQRELARLGRRDIGSTAPTP